MKGGNEGPMGQAAAVPNHKASCKTTPSASEHLVEVSSSSDYNMSNLSLLDRRKVPERNVKL